MITKEVLDEARKLWDYHHLYHTPVPADCILVLGSLDLRVADRGADLYLEGLAPILIFSGGLGKVTKGMWKDPEADLFARIALDKGVPAEAIFIENQSTNTGENILFTQRLLEDKGLHPQRFLLVQKPYMERRSYATFKKHWPDKELIVTSPQIAFEDYPTPEMPMERVIVTISTQGNTSAASVPLALDTGIRDGRVKRGQLLLLEAFGGGFTWGSALIRY